MSRKSYTVIKRVTIEYVWHVESEHLMTNAAAKRFALDIGEPRANEVSNVRETVTVREN